MEIATALDLSLKSAGLPIIGVSIGDPADKASWRVDFGPGVTEAQRAAAQALIGAFDPAAEPLPQILSKLAIVDQLTDRELETFIALRGGTASTVAPLSPAQQIRLALRWDNASEIDRLAEDVRQGLAAVFGPARMTALLGR